MTKSIYKIKNIRTLLTEGFTDKELRRLCFDHKEDFRPVYDQLSEYTGKTEIIDKLLEYAERHLLIKVLLEWAKKTNPEQYKLRQPYYNKWVEEIAADERPKLDNLKKFFNLKEHPKPKITIYLSRHSTAAEFQTFYISEDEANNDPSLMQIDNYHQQLKEQQLHLGEQQDSPAKFTAVSAVEMLEALYLKDEIEKSRLHDLFPIGIVKDILDTSLIEVNLEVCPKEDDIKNLGKGTVIFIGGPRANLGTRYYLFKLKAGVVRPTWWLRNIDECKQQTKNIIECIKNPNKYCYRCPEENLNLGLIQRYKYKGQTIIYLIGTGVNGTGAAVAYLRKKWIKLLKNKKDENFYKVIQVPRRDPNEKLTNYHQNYWWTDKKWTKVKF